MTQQYFNIQQILSGPLTEQHWPNLQKIIKQLQDYVFKSSKNREYIEAQKGSQKILEAQQHIKKRKIQNTSDRLTEAMARLSQKHNQQLKLHQRDWKIKLQDIQNQFTKEYNFKKHRHIQQLEKTKNQLQVALPISYSPDNQIIKLRWQEEQYAKQGKFIEAQKVKDRIQERQQYLQQRHSKFRENNIKQMLSEIQAKHERQLTQIKNKKEEKLLDLKKQKTKKLKDLIQRHGKQVREIKWIYSEEMKTVISYDL